MKTCSASFICLLYISTSLLVGCGLPPGKRLLQMEVYQGDKLILTNTFDVPDSKTPAEFWNYACVEPFGNEVNRDAMPSVTEDDREMLIEGNIELRINHGDDLMTSMKFDSLRLIRTDTDSAWVLTSESTKEAMKKGSHKW